MISLYNVSDYSTTEEFLLSFAKRFGLLKKKGIPDTFKAARVLVQDWNRFFQIIKIFVYTKQIDLKCRLINQVYKNFILEEKYDSTLCLLKKMSIVSSVLK